MPQYEVRAIFKHEYMHVYTVEADSLEEAMQEVEDGGGDFECRNSIDDWGEFDRFDDDPGELLDDGEESEENAE